MTRTTDGHVAWRTLADRRDGVLSAQRAADAAAHLASGCATCRARDESLRRLVTAVAAGALESPPAAVDRRVVALFGRLNASRRRGAPEASVREVPEAWLPAPLVGTLVADSHFDAGAAWSPALAMRSGDDGERRLLWTLGGYEVDASVVARGAASDVLGQILPLADESTPRLDGEVRAVRGTRAVQSSEIAPDGRFTFRGLAAGAYVFEGSVGGRPFVLPMVVLEGR